MTLNVVCAGVWPRCVHCDGKLVASHLLEKVFLFLVMALLLHTLLTLAAAAGLRILAGEKPAEMPLLAGRAHADMFDWRQLQRWGISEDRLPPASLVRYKVPSTWKQYQGLIIGSSLLCGAEALLIIGLLLQRKRGGRARG